MKRVTGIGGVFFKSDDPSRLKDWYVRHLGLPSSPYGNTAVFQWRLPDAPDQVGKTAWSVFPRDAEKFSGSFMLNYRVDDLDALLEALKAEGVEILPKQEDSPYGRFAWIVDPDGNPVELWQPLQPPPNPA